MSRRKQHAPNPNPLHDIAGTGVGIRAGGGGHIHAVTYDGEPVALAPLPPSRIERVEGVVRLVPATPEQLAQAKQLRQGAEA